MTDEDAARAVRWMDHILVCREPAETCTECRDGARTFIRSAMPPSGQSGRSRASGSGMGEPK